MASFKPPNYNMMERRDSSSSRRLTPCRIMQKSVDNEEHSYIPVIDDAHRFDGLTGCRITQKNKSMGDYKYIYPVIEKDGKARLVTEHDFHCRITAKYRAFAGYRYIFPVLAPEQPIGNVNINQLTPVNSDDESVTEKTFVPPEVETIIPKGIDKILKQPESGDLYIASQRGDLFPASLKVIPQQRGGLRRSAQSSHESSVERDADHPAECRTIGNINRYEEHSQVVKLEPVVSKVAKWRQQIEELGFFENMFKGNRVACYTSYEDTKNWQDDSVLEYFRDSERSGSVDSASVDEPSSMTSKSSESIPDSEAQQNQRGRERSKCLKRQFSQDKSSQTREAEMAKKDCYCLSHDYSTTGGDANSGKDDDTRLSARIVSDSSGHRPGERASTGRDSSERILEARSSSRRNSSAERIACKPRSQSLRKDVLTPERTLDRDVRDSRSGSKERWAGKPKNPALRKQTLTPQGSVEKETESLENKRDGSEETRQEKPRNPAIKKNLLSPQRSIEKDSENVGHTRASSEETRHGKAKHSVHNKNSLSLEKVENLEDRRTISKERENSIQPVPDDNPTSHMNNKKAENRTDSEEKTPRKPNNLVGKRNSLTPQKSSEKDIDESEQKTVTTSRKDVLTPQASTDNESENKNKHLINNSTKQATKPDIRKSDLAHQGSVDKNSQQDDEIMSTTTKSSKIQLTSSTNVERDAFMAESDEIRQKDVIILEMKTNDAENKATLDKTPSNEMLSVRKNDFQSEKRTEENAQQSSLHENTSTNLKSLMKNSASEINESTTSSEYEKVNNEIHHYKTLTSRENSKDDFDISEENSNNFGSFRSDTHEEEIMESENTTTTSISKTKTVRQNDSKFEENSQNVFVEDTETKENLKSKYLNFTDKSVDKDLDEKSNRATNLKTHSQILSNEPVSDKASLEKHSLKTQDNVTRIITNLSHSKSTESEISIDDDIFEREELNAMNAQLSVICNGDDSSGAEKCALNTEQCYERTQVGEIYEAIVDYDPPRSDKEAIALKEGQEVEVLDTSKVRRWLVRTRTFKGATGGQEGMVPACYLEKKTTTDAITTYETAKEKNETPKDEEVSKKRENVVKELVDTEQDFSRDMKYVVKNYLKEMESPEMPTKLRDHKDTLFGNFKDVCDFHNNELIKGVQYYANEPSKLGVTFLRLERDFDKHVNYCKNEPQAQEILSETPLKEYFDKYSKKIGDDKSLSEHLKLPLQRINDYQLLLKELIRYSVLLEEDTTDLKRALEFMQAIPQRASDTEFLNSIQGFKGNLHKLGKILMHDWFEVTEGKQGVQQERYVFLFKGRMCVTDVKRVTPEKDVYMMKHIAKVCIPKIKFSLQDVVVRETNDDRTLIIEHPASDEPSFPLKLRAKTKEQKESWVKELNVTAIPYEMEDLGEDEPTLIPEQTTEATEPKIEEPEPVEKSSEKQIEQRFQSRSENKVETLDDFEAYEELNTVVTESIRSGSVTSLDDVQSNLEDDNYLYLAASEVEEKGPSKPRFHKPLRGVTANQCEAAKFECEVGGQPESTVNWLKNNLQITKSERVETTKRENVHSLLISDVCQEDAGLYTAVATNSHGTTSCSAPLHVRPGLDVPKDDSRPTSPGGSVLPHAPVFKVKLKDTELLEGTSVRFELVVRGHPEPEITVYKNDVKLKEDERVRVVFENKEVFELILDHVVPGDAGKYLCVAVNSEGQASTTGNITVTKYKVLFQGLEDQQEVSKSPSPVPPVFRWFKDGADFEASERFKVSFDEMEDTLALVFQHVKPEDAGLYTCVASTCSGKISCSAELTVQGVVNQLPREPEPPQITATLSDVEVSEGASAMLELKVTGYPKPQIKWFHGKEEIEGGGRYKYLFEDENSYTLVVKNVTKSDSGMYKVVAKNELGEATTTGQLIVTSPPSFRKQMKDIAVMTDEPAKFEVEVEGKPVPDIKWYKDGQVVKEGARIHSTQPEEELFALVIDKVKPEDAGNYSCIVSNTCGSQTGFGTLVVNAPATFVKGLKDVETVEEETVKLSVKVAGNPKPTVKWMKDEKEIKEVKNIKMTEEENTHTLIVEKVTAEDAGEYKCKISNEYGSDTTNGKLGIKSKPVFTKKLTDMEFREGDSDVVLEVKAKSFPKATIRWMVDERQIEETENIQTEADDESGTYRLKLKEVKSDCSGKYTCEAKNAVGKSATSGVVTVNASPKFLKGLKDQNGTEGQDVSFSVKFSGHPKPKVKWCKDEASLTIDDKHVEVREDAADELTLIIHKVVDDDKGDYSCEISNQFGKDKSSGKLNMQGGPKFTKRLTDKIVRTDEETEFSVEVESFTKPKIRWLLDEKEIKNNKVYETESNDDTGVYKLKIKKCSKDEVGRYTCEASNSAGTADTSAKLTIKGPPKFIKGMTDKECAEDEEVSFTVKVDGKPKVTWLKDEAELTIDQRRIKTVEEAEDTFTLIIKKVVEDDDGKYSCHIKNDYGEDTSSGKLSVQSKPVFKKKLEDLEVREGETNVDFTVQVKGTPTPSVKWYFNGSEVKSDEQFKVVSDENSGNYKLVVKKAAVDSSGSFKCVAKNNHGTADTSAEFTVVSKPKIVKGLQDIEATEGEAVSLTVKVEGNPTPKGSWTKDGENVSALIRIHHDEETGNHVIEIDSLTLEFAGEYQFKASNKLGEATTKGKITVNSKPEFEKTIKDQETWTGEETIFEVKVNGQPQPSVTWYKDNEKIVESERIQIVKEDKVHKLIIRNTKMEDDGKYQCKAQNKTGEATTSGQLSVKCADDSEAPTFIRKMADILVVVSDAARFEVKVAGKPCPDVTWYKNGEELSATERIKIGKDISDNYYSLTLKDIVFDDEDEYSCKAVNEKGEATSSAKLTVKEPVAPEITGMTDLEVKWGTVAKFEIEASGLPIPEITWLKDGQTVLASDNVVITSDDEAKVYSLAIRSVKEEDIGSYVCQASNSAGNTAVESSLSIKAEAPVFLKDMKDAEGKKGENAEFDVRLSGYPLPEVTWYRDNKPLTSGSHTKISKKDDCFHLKISGLESEDFAIYSCKAVNSAGEASSTAALRQSEMKPTVEKLLPPKTAVMEEEPLKLEAKIDGQPAPDIKWMKDGEEIKPDNRVKVETSPDGTTKLTIDSAKPSDAGKYEMIAKNDAGEVRSPSQVKVEPADKKSTPKFEQDLKPIALVIGKPSRIEVKAVGTPKPQIAWMKNGEPVESDDHIAVEQEPDGTAALIIQSPTPEDAGKYTCIATNEAGDVTTSAPVTVQRPPAQKPTFAQGLKPVQLTEGQPAKLEAKISGEPKPNVKWLKDGKELQPDDHISIMEGPDGTVALILDNVTPEDAGKYSVVVSNDEGEAKSEAPVTVLPKAKRDDKKKKEEKPQFEQPLLPALLTEGKPGQLEAKVSGKPMPDVKWQKDGKDLVPDSHMSFSKEPDGNVKLLFDEVKPEDSGKYAVIASSPSGEKRSEAKVTTVPDMKSPISDTSEKKPEFVKNLEPTELIEGQPLKLVAEVYSEPKCNIKWLKDGEEVKPSNRLYMTEEPDGRVGLNIDHALPEDSGKYAVVATNDEGKTRSAAPVDVKAVPKEKPQILTGLSPIDLNTGQPGKLTAKVQGHPKPAIKWLKDGQEIKPDGRIKIKEEPDGNSTLEIDSVLPEDAGKYTIVAANENGETRSSAPVTVNHPPIFSAPLQSTDAVEGFPCKIEGVLTGEPLPDLKWLQDGKPYKPKGPVKEFQTPDGNMGLLFEKCAPEDSGNYCCVATNPHGETSSAADLNVKSAEITGEPESAPIIMIPLNDVEVKEGEPIKFQATIKANPLPTIEWFLDDQPIFPSNNIHQTFDGKKAILNIYKSNPQHAGKFECRASNLQGRASSIGCAKVTERSAPKFTQRLVDTEAPSSEPLKLVCRVKGFPEPEIQWYYNGSPIESGLKYNTNRDGDLCTLTLPHPRAKDSGVYECRARNAVGDDKCKAEVKVSDKGAEKGEAPMFLKKIGDCHVMDGMDAKFTACITGVPKPDIKWFKNGEELQLTPRHKLEVESNGLLRLIIRDIQPSDLGEYRISISNPYGSATCTGQLQMDNLDQKYLPRPLGDQYPDYDKFRKSGAPVPLPDKPRIVSMSDHHAQIAWKPSIPIYPRIPVTYQLEFGKHPDGDWTPFKTGIKDSTCDVRGLEPGRDYRFRVRVENKFGTSDPSPYVTAHRSKFQPPTPGEFKPKDYELEHPPLDKNAAAPRFLRKEEDTMYGVKGHPVSIEFWVYGYPEPKVTWYFGHEKIEGGKYDFLQDRNGQLILFLTRMTEADEGTYSCHAINEHGEARQKIKLLMAEPPMFTKRLQETTIMIRQGGFLECKVTGVPYPKIKWFKDWHPLYESSRIKIVWIEPDKCSLYLSDSILKDSGLYTCSATNIAGTATSSAMVTIEESETEYDLLTYSRPRITKPRNKPFEDYYDIGDELGRGTQGIVYHAVERATGKSYAAKIMHGTKNFRDYMTAEMDIMNQLCHPRLVRLWDAMETKASLSLITDLCGGGELLDHIINKGSLTESEVAHYVRQVLEGIEHMHGKKIGHLGLSIGDILVSRMNGDSIKICDFGLAARIHPGRNFIQLYGHPEFVAPELVKKQPATLASDMWSVGVVTYLLLSGISPFLGANDRETLTHVQEGKINFFNDAFAEVSDDARDFISKLLVFEPNGRMDVKKALEHPWLKLASVPDKGDQLNNIDRLKDYYNKWKDWYANASCKRFYRRRPMESCFTHPSKMIYPPGEEYTPPDSPEKELHRTKVKPAAFDDTYQQKINREAIDVRSESQYQCGPDTYLLQLRDTDFPMRVRQYLRVGASRSPSLASNLREGHWGDSRVSVRERRRFVDVMDEEIDDEQKGHVDRSMPMRLQREIGSPHYTHEQIKSLKREARREKGIKEEDIGSPPFFREKIIDVVIKENQEAVFKCMSIGSPEPQYSWFRNDGILVQSSRIQPKQLPNGRCELHLYPAKVYDVGVYKCVARNTHGVAICRARLKIGDVPGRPNPPEVSQVTNTEAYIVWGAPRFDGNSPILYYSLEYKETAASENEWKKVSENLEQEFYVVKGLVPNTNYHFRISAINKFGWGIASLPSKQIDTLAEAGGKIKISKARQYQQAAAERAKDLPPCEDEVEEPDYSKEENPIDMITGGTVSELYNFVAEVARGRFSLVVKTWVKQKSETLVSKLIYTTADNEEEVQREFDIIKTLCHQNVVSLLAASKHENLTVLVMERLSGVDILTFLSAKHLYNEETVARIIQQVLNGLDYLHHRGICYLELQPDNVVLINQKRLLVKLVDFGSAHYIEKEGEKIDFKGTLEYMAPEVLKKEEVSNFTDIWCVGVLTYILLSGVSPFRGESDSETIENIGYVRYRFDNLHKEVTQEATRFLMHIFKRTPQKRPTTEECLEHKWLLPSEFLLKKREHAVFLSHQLHEFSEQFHAQKQASTPPKLQGMFGMSFNRSISLEEDTYEED